MEISDALGQDIDQEQFRLLANKAKRISTEAISTRKPIPIRLENRLPTPSR